MRVRLLCRGDGTREEPLAIRPSQSALSGFRHHRTIRRSLPDFRTRRANSLLSRMRPAVTVPAQQLRTTVAGFAVAGPHGPDSSACAAFPLPESQLPARGVHRAHRRHSSLSSPDPPVGGELLVGLSQSKHCYAC